MLDSIFFGSMRGLISKKFCRNGLYGTYVQILFKFCSNFVKLVSEILFFGRKMVVCSFVLFVAILGPISANLFINCSSQRVEKDAIMYLNSTMDRFSNCGDF